MKAILTALVCGAALFAATPASAQSNNVQKGISTSVLDSHAQMMSPQERRAKRMAAMKRAGMGKGGMMRGGGMKGGSGHVRGRRDLM